MTTTPALPVVTYRRVSTQEQGISGLGLDAQASTINAELERRAWVSEADYTDVATSDPKRHRQGLADAVDHAKRSGGILVAAKLDRLERDVIAFAQLLNRAQQEGWAVLVLDLPLDTTTAAGRFAALTLANSAELERGLIRERTKAALKIRAAELAREGKRLGREVKTPTWILERVTAERDAGSTWQAIADRLNDEHVPTTRGGKAWAVGTVQSAYKTAQLERDVAATAKV